MKKALKRNRMLAKRIAAIALSLVTVISLLPFTIFAQTDNEQPAESKTELNEKFQNLMDPGTPENYSEDMANPYGYEKGRPFLLSEQNELLLYYTYETDKNSDNTKGNRHTAWYDKYVHGGDTTLRDDSKGTVQGGFSAFGEYNRTDAYSYVTAVSFDPTGSGRRDHVAYVGYENVKDRKQGYYVWVLNTRTGEQYGPTRISKADNSSWLEDKNADLYAGSNFFGIVAGDFDGDGKEHLILTVTDNDNRYGLYHISLDNNKNFITHEWEEKNQLHPLYVSNQNKMGNTNGDMGAHKLSVSLAAGDFNGDGIDDLAVLSYPNIGNRLNGNKGDLLDSRFGLPYLSVTYGSKGNTYLLGNKKTSCYVTAGPKTVKIGNMGEDTFTFDHSTSICTGLAAGDINGDGIDEIVTAGYHAVSHVNNGQLWYEGFDSDKWLYGSFTAANGTVSSIEYQELDRNAWSKNATGENDKVGPKVAVACAAVDGKVNPDRIFISGDIYRCSNGGNKLDTTVKRDDKGNEVKNSRTVAYFTDEDKYAEGHGVSKSYIASVAVGNFEETNEGYEQIFYVVGLQAKNTSDFRYSFSVHSIGVDTRDSNGLAEVYLPKTGGYIYRNQKFGLDKRPNVLIVAIDRDDDGVLAKYKGSSYTWSDPEIMAILQASPYFGDVEDYLYDSPDTTYNETVEYEYEYGTTNAVSVGAGAALTLTGTLGGFDLQTGYAMDWSETFKKGLSESISQSFSAGAYDTVVLNRTPVFLYNYDVTYKDGNKVKNDVLEIAVPRGPRYEQLSIGGYNEFVEYYNSQIKAAADKKGIAEAEYQKSFLTRVSDKLYLGTEGDPFGYYIDNISGGLNPVPEKYGEAADSSVAVSAVRQTESLAAMQTQLGELREQVEIQNRACKLAYVALICAIISLLWNAVSLILDLQKRSGGKKKEKLA